MGRKVKLLTTKGDGKFIEVDWEKPHLKPNEVEVKAVMTGICRSDIDMMQGRFNLPMHMHGHEGLGIITAVGSEIDDYHVGTYVATRGEPAYADYYNTPEGMFVPVPALEPKYIVEPIACGINIFKSFDHLKDPISSKICIIGTGFLSSIVFQNMRLAGAGNITVVGSHNRAYWLLKHAIEVQSEPDGKYDVVVDLSNNSLALTKDIFKSNAVLVLGASKHPGVTSTFDYCLWNSVTILCPSPRAYGFHHCMFDAVRQVQNNSIDISNFWTRGYNRHTEWQQAFEDSLNRPVGFNRAYIYWP